MHNTAISSLQKYGPNFLNIPVGPRPVVVPPAVLLARRERAMDIEYAFMRLKYPAPLVVHILGDALVVIDWFKRKTVTHKIVRLDP